MDATKLTYYTSSLKVLGIAFGVILLSFILLWSATDKKGLGGSEIIVLTLVSTSVIVPNLISLKRLSGDKDGLKVDNSPGRGFEKTLVLLFLVFLVATLYFYGSKTIYAMSLFFITCGAILLVLTFKSKQPLLELTFKGFRFKLNYFSSTYVIGSWSEVLGIRVRKASIMGGGLVLELPTDAKSPILDRYPKIKKNLNSKAAKMFNAEALAVHIPSLKGVSEKEFIDQITNFAKHNSIKLESSI
jgi:hypothetical protein